MNDNPQLADGPMDIAREGRYFRVEYEPSPLATGWMLRERHHDGWPVAAGPFDTSDDAIDQIDEMLDAGPLCRHQADGDAQVCWV